MTSGFDVNWDAYTHQELYNMIHNLVGGHFIPRGTVSGQGVAGGATAQDDWASLQQAMRQISDDTLRSLRRAGANWTGQASDHLQSSVASLALWNQDVSDAGTTNSGAVADHVDHYVTAKNTMPEPVQITSTANSDFFGLPADFTHLLGIQTDQDTQNTAAQAAKQHAVEIMTNYSIISQNAVDSMRSITAPSNITVAVAPPQPVATPPAAGPNVGPNTAAPGVHGGVTTTASTPLTTSGAGPSGTPAPSVAPPTPAAPTPAGTRPIGTTTTASTPSPSPSPSTQPAPIAATTTPGPATDQPIGVPAPGPVAMGRPLGGGGAGATRAVAGPTGRGPLGPGPVGNAPRSGVGALAAQDEAQLARAAGTAAADRAAPLGAPMTAGGRDEEDTEHDLPDYLRGPHDEFWQGTEKYIVRTIGEDD